MVGQEYFKLSGNVEDATDKEDLRPDKDMIEHALYSINTGRHELRLLFNTDKLIGIPIHIGKWTLTEAIDRALQEARHQSRLTDRSFDLATDFTEQLAKSLYGIVSLVLYLCSDEPEIDDERQPGVGPKRPQVKKTKSGWRLFSPAKSRIWAVGKHLGEQLRQTNQTISTDVGKRTLKPHLRRAHWHGFWLGPKEGERRFSYKWLPPMIIAGNSDQDEVPNNL